MCWVRYSVRRRSHRGFRNRRCAFDKGEQFVNEQNGLAALSALVESQRIQIAELQHSLGILQDKDEIQRLQYAYGYLLDNRMFREIADLFANQDAWMEIGG